jgi:uncharacterized protein YdeI (YjbR/CyaY-like superfamily)
MTENDIPGGVVHDLPDDLQQALLANPSALATWHDITPLARNEWICWITSAKQRTTRSKRLDQGCAKLAAGERRPCCWPGCPHRDKTGRTVSPKVE